MQSYIVNIEYENDIYQLNPIEIIGFKALLLFLCATNY